MREFKCIGYFSHWNGGFEEKLRFDILTHVNFAFAIPTAQGHLIPQEHPDVARKAVAMAHAAGAKACISVGGWSYLNVPLEPAFREATNTPEKLESLAREIVLRMDEFDFDGVDIDWEYPRPGDGSKEQYEALISRLHELLHPRGKLLTAAVFAGVDSQGQPLEVSAAQDRPSFDKLDWLNLMTYDCDGPVHASYPFVVNCVDYWARTRGFAPEKLVLGLPFYGRPAPAPFYRLLEADAEALEKDTAVLDGREVHYNGRDTLQKKVALAKAEGLGGVMIWDIAEDTPDRSRSLLTAVGQAL